MTNDTNTTPASRTPTHHVFQVRDRGKVQKGVWTRVGIAWAQRDGKDFDVLLDPIPLDGRLTLRVPFKD